MLVKKKVCLLLSYEVWLKIFFRGSGWWALVESQTTSLGERVWGFLLLLRTPNYVMRLSNNKKSFPLFFNEGSIIGSNFACICPHCLNCFMITFSILIFDYFVLSLSLFVFKIFGLIIYILLCSLILYYLMRIVSYPW